MSQWGDGLAAYLQSLDQAMQNGTPTNNRERQFAARRAMSGRDPSLGPQDRAGIARRSGLSEDNSQSFERGMSELVLGQPARAVGAVGEAFSDPSIANLTNAGAQTALAAFRPIAAGKVALGGLGAAAVSDSGVINSLIPSAVARNSDRDKARLAREQAKAATATAAAEVEILRARTESERAAAEQRLKEAQENASRSEYEGSVRRAEGARDEILSNRPKRFNETDVGKVYDKLGIIAPGVIAAGMGGLTRAGAMAAGYNGKVASYAAPIGVGGLTGGVAANYPLGHELMFAPAGNLEKEAYQAYARELPPTHPRKQEMADYARGLEDANPSRKAASDEFYDPVKMAERAGFGVAEGLLGGLAGSEIVGIGARGVSGARNALFGNTGARTNGPGAGGQQGLPPTPIPPTPQAVFSQYPQMPTSSRVPIQEAYLAGRAIQGGDLPPRATAGAIKQSLSDQGVSVPVTANRINATNEAYNAFVAAVGRPPTRSEFAQIFNSRTLSIPLAGGVAAGTVNHLMQGQP